MGLLSNKISREELNPGDHIYSYKAAYIYSHHGIYIGDDMVIHFTKAAGRTIGSGTLHLCERCGYHKNLDGVIKSCIDCFLGGGSNLYMYEYGVPLLYFFAKFRGGSCTIALQDPAQYALLRAKASLDRGYGPYNLIDHNCEDFAFYCKTGLFVDPSHKPVTTGQIASWVSIVVIVIFTIAIIFLFKSIVIRLLFVVEVVVFSYSFGRLANDISGRSDAMKVPLGVLLARAGAAEPPRASELEIV